MRRINRLFVVNSLPMPKASRALQPARHSAGSIRFSDSFRSEPITFRQVRMYFSPDWQGNAITVSTGKIPAVNEAIVFRLNFPDETAPMKPFFDITWHRSDDSSPEDATNRAIEDWLFQHVPQFHGSNSGISRKNGGTLLVVAGDHHGSARIVQDFIDFLCNVVDPYRAEQPTRVIQITPEIETVILVSRLREEISSEEKKQADLGLLMRGGTNGGKIAPNFVGMEIRIERTKAALKDFETTQSQRQPEGAIAFLIQLLNTWKKSPVSLAERETREDALKKEWWGDSSTDE